MWPQEAAVQKLVFPRARKPDRGPDLLVIQGLISGLLFGGVYSLMAVGLTLIFGVMRVVNFAHGDMMVWGMYLALLLATRVGLDPYLGFVVCAAALFLLGLVVQRALVDRIVDAPHEMQILLMLGVALVLENTALLVFGPEPARVRSPLAAATWFARPVLRRRGPPRDVRGRHRPDPPARLLPLPHGPRADDPGRRRQPVRRPGHRHRRAARLRRRLRRRRGVRGRGGGARRRPSCRSQPSDGPDASVASFNIVIIGGMGSLLGAFVGGLLVSVAESLGAVFLRPSLKELLSFSLLIVILLFRPAGLFGKRAA